MNRHDILLYMKANIPSALQKIVRRMMFSHEHAVAEDAYRLLSKTFADPSGNAVEGRSYQRVMLSKLLNYCDLHCPYYRRIFTESDIHAVDDFARIPLLSKSDVRANAKELCSDVIKREKVYTFTTGGTTGEPLALVISRQAGAVDSLHQRFALELAGYAPEDRILAFDGTEIPSCAVRRGIYWTRKSASELPYGGYHVSSRHFSDATAESYIDFITQLKPRFLRGYPSFISQFTDAIRVLSPGVDLNIKAVQLTAETIPEWQVAQIRATLRCDVILQYGHSEACVFGFSTLNGSDYYCSPFYGVTEVIDSEGQHVDVGQSGEVVVTGLHNRGMPLIRYRTGDEAVYGGTRNGFVILQRVLGRTQDFLLDASGNRVSVTGSIMAQHFSAFRSIAKWQIIQTIPGRVKMKLVKASGYRDEDEMEIRRKLAAACDIKLDIEYVSDIPVTSRGKHRFVINTCIAGPTSRSNPSDC